ncbi:hypothetical protein CB1_000875022 [Camelus ferus]|nr:hypothetical protein CB1_000875022 [Camelus ferus]
MSPKLLEHSPPRVNIASVVRKLVPREQPVGKLVPPALASASPLTSFQGVTNVLLIGEGLLNPGIIC